VFTDTDLVKAVREAVAFVHSMEDLDTDAFDTREFNSPRC
jgi:hypothetical protein